MNRPNACQYDIDQGVRTIRAVTIIRESSFAYLSGITSMTNNDNKIQNAAAKMIERYGENALNEVDLRILELQSRNQQDAVQLWRKISKRVKFLLHQSSDSEYH